MTNLIFNYAGTILTIAKGIVFVPLYLRHFDLGTYGAWLASANVLALLGMVDVGVNLVFSQRLSDSYGSRDLKRFAQVAASGGIVFTLTSTIFACTGIVLAPFIPQIIHASTSEYHALSTTFALTAVGTALTLAQSNVFSIAYAWQRTAVVGVTRLLVQGIELSVILLALHAGAGVVALGLAACLSSGIGLGIASTWVIRKWKGVGLPTPNIERGEVSSIIRASLPVLLSRVASVVMGNFETALVAVMVTPEAAAIYGITDRIFRLGQQIINPIAGSVFNGLAHLVGEGGEAKLRKILHEVFSLWALAVTLIFPLMLALNRSFVSLWVGADKMGGIGFSIALCASSIFATRTFLLTVILSGLGEIAVTAWGTVAELAVRLPLMAVGLSTVGLVGVPLAVIAGNLALNLWWFPRIVNRRLHFPSAEGFALQAAGVWAVVATFSIGCFVTVALPTSTSWLGLFVRAILLGAIMAGVSFGSSRALRLLIADLAGKVIMRRQATQVRAG